MERNGNRVIQVNNQRSFWIRECLTKEALYSGFFLCGLYCIGALSRNPYLFHRYWMPSLGLGFGVGTGVLYAEAEQNQFQLQRRETLHPTVQL